MFWIRGTWGPSERLGPVPLVCRQLSLCCQNMSVVEQAKRGVSVLSPWPVGRTCEARSLGWAELLGRLLEEWLRGCRSLEMKTQIQMAL